MLVDIGDDLIDPVILADVLADGDSRVGGVIIGTGDLHEKFYDPGMGQCPAAHTGVAAETVKLIDEPFHLGKTVLAWADQAIVLAGGIGKTGRQVVAEIPDIFEEVAGQPDDETFIGFPCEDLRTMDILVAGEQNIPGTELVGAAFDHIVGIAREKDEDLIEGMLMKADIRGRNIDIMMVFVIALDHELAQCEFFL